MDEEKHPELKRVRLTGARFDGGRLPIDSLVELQSYQNVIRIAAEAEWRQRNPDEDLPPDFHQAVSLTIERIDNGSADVFLAFEQQQVYVEYQAEAEDAADAFIVAAYSDAEIPAIPGLAPEQDEELRTKLIEIGSTLTPEQAIEFYPDGPESVPVSITIETRKNAVDRLSRIEDFLIVPGEEEKPAGIEKSDESLIGRVTAVDAENKKLTLRLSNGKELACHYKKHPELLEDVRDLVNSAAEGPLTRVTGELQRKKGELSRFWDTHTVEQVQFDDTPWGARLAEFAELSIGWDGGDAPQITFMSLDAAQMILRFADENGLDRPGVFPTEEGGVLIEWASTNGVSSIEVLPDGTFEMFSIAASDHTGEHSSSLSVKDATSFMKAVLA